MRLGIIKQRPNQAACRRQVPANGRQCQSGVVYNVWRTMSRQYVVAAMMKNQKNQEERWHNWLPCRSSWLVQNQRLRLLFRLPLYWVARRRRRSLRHHKARLAGNVEPTVAGMSIAAGYVASCVRWWSGCCSTKLISNSENPVQEGTTQCYS